MFCSIQSAVLHGVDPLLVRVEVDISDGLPSFDMVGLLNSEIKEARERVRSALKNSGILIPPKRITVNLSPAALRKVGTNFDLPMAVGVLCSMGEIKGVDLSACFFAGELSLNGDIVAVKGVLPMVYYMAKLGIKYCFVPFDNVKEAAIVSDVKVIGIRNLKELIEIIKDNPDKYVYGGEKILDDNSNIVSNNTYNSKYDFSYIYGQEAAKRAAIIAVCGMHHLLMVGTPGSGKTLLATCMSTIMPLPDITEAIEISKINSVAGLLDGNGLVRERPFRAPHHNITMTAMTGGGYRAGCGEVTLAHKGILFLDELAEFDSAVIDSLRQPLESREITISRADGSYHYPAEFMLVAATNPCKCGYYPDFNRCRCSQNDVTRYLGRISKPVLDRIDICIGIEEVKPSELIMARNRVNNRNGNKNDIKNNNNRLLTSGEIRKEVERVREIQRDRFRNASGTGEEIRFNSRMEEKHIKKFCNMTKDADDMLKLSFDKLKLTMRGYYKTLRTARTIADYEGEEIISEMHMAEALGYRATDIEKMLS